MNTYIYTFTDILRKLEGFETTIESIADYFQMSTYNYGRNHFKFVINWCQDVIDGLN